MIKNLTICIPTYNRPDELKRQLASLIAQDLSKVYEIIVLDNASNYDVKNLINKFNSDKIRLIRHKFNIGMGINLAMPMLFCESKWLWILSDDDEISVDAISLVTQQIAITSPKTGMIKFGRDGVFNRPSIVSSLVDYIDYYYSEKNPRRGDLVFLSTSILNLDLLKENITQGFEYAYSLLGFLVPVVIGLNKKIIQVEFCSDTLVKYCLPKGDGWCHLSGAEKISTVAHLPVILNRKYRRRFLDIFMPLSWQSLIVQLANHDDEYGRQSVLNAYFGIYRFYLPIYHRVLFIVLYRAISTRLGRIVVSVLIGLFRRLQELKS